MKTVRAFAAVSDTANSSSINEDAYLAVPKRQLFGIADGFGGRGVGDEAAKKALGYVTEFVDHSLGDREFTSPFIYRTYLTTGSNLIFNAFLYANKNLCMENKKRHINVRGGASMCFAFFDGKIMTLANVGGCSAFLIRSGEVSELVKPRTYNHMRAGEKWNPKWAFPLMALGQAMDLEPEIIELTSQPGDVIVLASDGVYPFITKADWAEYATLADENPETLEASLDALNKAVLEKAKASAPNDDGVLLAIQTR